MITLKICIAVIGYPHCQQIMLPKKHLQVAAAMLGWFVFSITLSAYNKFLFGVVSSTGPARNCSAIAPPPSNSTVKLNTTITTTALSTIKTVSTRRDSITLSLTTTSTRLLATAVPQPSQTATETTVVRPRRFRRDKVKLLVTTLPAASTTTNTTKSAAFDPLLTTSIHMTLHFILALFLLAGGWRYLKDLWSAIAGNGRFDSVSWHWQSIEWPPTRTYLTTLLPCALATALDIGLSNTSLKFISLSMYTMMKSTTPAFVLLVAFLFRLEPVERRLLAVIVLLCGGAALMGQRPEECYRTSLPTAVICPPPGSGDSVDDYDYDYDHHHPHPHQGNDDDSSSRRFWIGLTCVLIASAMSGVRWALTQILLHRGQGRNIDDDNSHQNNPTETSSSYRPITTITNTNTNTNTITNTNTNTNQISRWTGESRRQKNNRQDERIPLRTVASGDQLLGASRASGASSDGQSSENSDSDTDDRFVTPDDIWSEEKGGGENAQDNRLFDIPNNPSSSTNPINKRLATARDDGDSQMEPRSAAVNANQSENYPATSRSRSPPNDKRDRSINESPLESDDDDDYGGRGRGRGGTEEQSGQTQRRPGHPRQLYNIFLLSPIMAVLLLFASTLIEHPFSGGKQSENGGPMSDNAVAAFFMMLAGGLMAFMMILSEFWLISLTGAVTLSVAGMFKELLTILTAILLFKDCFSTVNIIGLVVTLFAIGYYNYIRVWSPV